MRAPEVTGMSSSRAVATLDKAGLMVHVERRCDPAGGGDLVSTAHLLQKSL